MNLGPDPPLTTKCSECEKFIFLDDVYNFEYNGQHFHCCPKCYGKIVKNMRWAERESIHEQFLDDLSSTKPKKHRFLTDDWDV